MNRLELTGCSPEPLMSYLKTLGILRLVNEQKDPKARGWWDKDAFVLATELSREQFIHFIKEEYRPSPFFSPWNAGAGFIEDGQDSSKEEDGEKDSRKKKAEDGPLEKIKSVGNGRLDSLKEGVMSVEGMPSLKAFSEARNKLKRLEDTFKNKYGSKNWRKRLSEEEKTQYKPLVEQAKRLKEGFIFQVRNDLSDISLCWLDACLLVEADGFASAPILGSGGCDGRMEFSLNYLENLLLVLDNPENAHWLEAALFGGSSSLIGGSLGQFAPGQLGGPNGTQGMEGNARLNPWDFVLMIEGTVLFAGAISRKLGTSKAGRSAFPFTVSSSFVAGTMASKESKEARGELWLPLWERPIGIQELRQIFTEGRAEWGGRQSVNAVDIARAATSFGVDRGILTFARQGFLKRNGLAYLATPLGRFPVGFRTRTFLLKEIDPWLNRFRNACGDKAPQRFQVALHRIDTAIFNYCRHGGAERFCSVLQSLGSAERELALTAGQIGQSQFAVPPLGRLSFAWIVQASDNSPEFDLALALASIGWSGNTPGPCLIRRNLEPVDLGKGRDQWAEKDRRVVWTRGSLCSNLAAVLYRRVMDAGRTSEETSPFFSSHSASLGAIGRLIHGEIGEQRLEDLLWGMMAIDFSENSSMVASPLKSDSTIPRAYAMLKLLFLPYGFIRVDRPDGSTYWRPCQKGEKGFVPRCGLRILNLLEANRIAEACKLAYQRLNSGGMEPMSGLQEEEPGGIDGNRLAAALLIPIDTHTMGRLAALVLRKPDKQPQEEGVPSHAH